MSDPFWALLAVLTVLQVKHFIFDYPLQTLYQLQNKGTYGHPGGIIHSALHALATMVVFLIVPPTIGLGIALVVGEFLVHYHIDWAKSQINEHYHLQPNQREFWWMIGADQLVHHLTYLAVGGILVGMMVGA